ncbi:hypothetical protein APB44_22745, partial [Pseudomonas aeruginosa]
MRWPKKNSTHCPGWVDHYMGMSVHSLYAWIKVYSKPQEQRQQDDDQQAELRKLRAELKRVTEERDIL